MSERNHAAIKSCSIFIFVFCLLAFPIGGQAQPAEELLTYLKSLGNGSYMFGQVATWVHNEDPDMTHPSNWVQKVHDHTDIFPRYACITYDFHDDPFSDAEWNEGVKKLRDRGMIVGVYNFFANPSGGAWNDPCQSELIWAPGENAVKANFYKQLDRMAANLQWLKDKRIAVVYTPFVESDDQNKWHAKQGSNSIIRLYRLVHDYFERTKGLDNIIWAYHTTQRSGTLERCYPGDDYVDVLGKSAAHQSQPPKVTTGENKLMAGGQALVERNDSYICVHGWEPDIRKLVSTIYMSDGTFIRREQDVKGNTISGSARVVDSDGKTIQAHFTLTISEDGMASEAKAVATIDGEKTTFRWTGRKLPGD